MGIGSSQAVNLKSVFATLTTGEVTNAEQWAQWRKALSVKLFTCQEIIDCLGADDIRQFRSNKPQQFARMCLHLASTFCNSARGTVGDEETKIRVLNCCRLLIRLVPFLYEDLEWRGFFWSSLPPPNSEQTTNWKEYSLAEELLHCLCISLFTPGLTVCQDGKREESDEFSLIWEAGIGPMVSPHTSDALCDNRIDLLRLLLTLCSEGLYLPRTVDAHSSRNRWIEFVTSKNNPRLLCLFTSLFNTMFSYRQAKTISFYQRPNFNRHTLAEVCAQLFCVLSEQPSMAYTFIERDEENIFVVYLSRLHLDEDYGFTLNGFSTLLDLSIPAPTLISAPCTIDFHQEVLLLFWKMININPGFLSYLLRHNDSLEILFALLYHLNEASIHVSKHSQLHLCILILLQLSGERNFGVRLNRPVLSKQALTGIPIKNGCFADLLFIVLHRTVGSSVSLESMDFLLETILSIILNVSPYIKSIKPVTAEKLLHLVEVFSTPWFIFEKEHNYRFVYYILYAIENLIQHQFDGNTALAYVLVRKRQAFYDLANLKFSQASSYGQKAPVNKSAACCCSLESVLLNVPVVTMTLEGKLFDNGQVPWECEHSSDWKPTQEWFQRWHSDLPLATIVRTFEILVPQINKICLDDSITDCDYIINFLKSGTLVGLLPPAPPIVVRRLRWNDAALSLWILLYTWSCIACRESSAQRFIWRETKVASPYDRSHSDDS